jgi:WD40 repeat protein
MQAVVLLKIWDSKSGELIRTLEEERLRSINSASLSPDSKYIVSVSDDDTIQILDSESGNLLKTIYCLIQKF